MCYELWERDKRVNRAQQETRKEVEAIIEKAKARAPRKPEPATPVPVEQEEVPA